MNLEKNPDILVADKGYLNDDILEKAYKENIIVIIPDRNEASKAKPENMKKQYAKVNFNTISKKTSTPAHKDQYYSIKMTVNLMAYGTKYIQQMIVKLAANMTNVPKVALEKYSNPATP